MESEIKVCLGIPTTGFVYPQSFYSHLALAVVTGRVSKIIIPSIMNVFPHDKARLAVWDAAKANNVDYVLFVDSDMVVEPTLFIELLDALRTENAQMAVAHCYRRGYPFTSTWTKVGPDQKSYNVSAAVGHPPVEIDASGLAANLIDFKWVEEHCEDPLFFHGTWDNEFFWEDGWFCKRIKRNGGKIIGVPNSRTEHAIGMTYVSDDNVDNLRAWAVKKEHEQELRVLSEEEIVLANDLDDNDPELKKD